MNNKYRRTEVDLEIGYEPVRLIKNHITRTKVKGAIDSVGALGGMFDLSVLNMKKPVLVNGTDGVDTKLLVAFEMDKHDTVGTDTVAMCAGDVLIQGVAPVFFLDYLTVGKNEPKKIGQLVRSVADGCVQAERTLIGGETAEMPGMYDAKHCDITGFCVGAVDKRNLLNGQKIKEGSVLVGPPNTGVHSNGFSLIRKVLLEDTRLDLHKEYEEVENQELGDVLLTSMKIYVKATKHLLGKVNIKEMSHITGGGFYENMPRMLKEGQGVTIDTTAYPHKPIFDMIVKYGSIPIDKTYNVFDMGIGFMMVVDKKDVDIVQNLLKEIHEKSCIIGEVTNSGSVDAE